MKFSEDGRKGSEAHTRALHRLDEARDHERTMHNAVKASQDTMREFQAASELGAASEKTAAREAWVAWVERGY